MVLLALCLAALGAGGALLGALVLIHIWASDSAS